ncbi:MAG: YitT family protein [Roseburia sp.]|nr:YitT family protein [Ruminococcus sp.]MCM1155845.1 YitT family protein [Roseburia sp.]MCM1243979.1 YitT family protein [Roseburia sp.]
MAAKTIKKYAIITVSAFLNAMAISLFIDPNNLAPGGVTGIAIIISRFLPVETGTLIFILNIPIFLFAVWQFGIRFTISTIYALALISTFTNLLAPMGAATDDILLAALAGGVLYAVSIGIIMKMGATTGGMDIIVKWLRVKLPYLKTGVLFFITDVIIVSMSGIVFQDIDAALYAGITVVVNSIVLDLVLYGRDEAKLLYIISDRPKEITERILTELDIGVTYIEGRGAYSGREKQVLMCVAKKQISPRVEVIVKEEDAEAFMVITSATEIFGEGFKSYFAERF